MLMSMETWEHFSRLKVFPGKYRVAGDVSLPPPTDKLFMSIRIDCLIHEYFPDYYYYTQHLEHIERGSFELHPNTLLLSDTSTMSRILSSAGIPTDYHPQLLPQIIFQAKMAMISSTTYYCNNIYDVPWITVVVLFGKLIRPPNDDYYFYDDEEEEIRRATEESLLTMMDIATFKPGPASKSSIEALEKARFVQGLDYSSVLEAEEQCMICLEKLLIINSSSPAAAAALKVEVEQVTRMPCLHLYHADCIVRWLETSNLCPVCRFQMPTS